MIKVKRFVNQLLSSNCFVIYDDTSKKAIIIDPGNENSEAEILFMDKKRVYPDYIITTHEHTDHNWGVNSIRKKYPKVKLICSEICDKIAKKTNRIFFSLYKDDPTYEYVIEPAEITINNNITIEWNQLKINFILTPGHSYGSMCVDINGMLFTGDTVMQYKPYFNGRDSNIENWKESIAILNRKYSGNTKIYPGHGNVLTLDNWNKYYKPETILL